MTAGYRRQVSLSEWQHLANPADASRTIQVFVEGVGTIDHAALVRAVAAASDAVPGSRLTRRGRSWVDSGSPPPVRMLDCDPLTSEASALRGIYRPLRGDRGGPHNEVVLLTGESSGVVFRAHHCVMDGKGLLTWAAAVFCALRGEPVEPVLCTLTDQDLAARAGAPEPGGERVGKVAAVLRTRKSFAARGRIVRRRTLAGNHPAFVAKLAAAVNDVLGLPEAVFLVMVDLRRHAPGVRSTGNLVGAVPLRLAPGATWRQAHSQMLDSLDGRAELAMFSGRSRQEYLIEVPQPVMRLGRRIGDTVQARLPRTDFQLVLSHWGRLDLADFATATFAPGSVFAVPQPGYSLPGTFTIVETPGRTELVFTCDGGPHAGERADRLLDRIVTAVAQEPTAPREPAASSGPTAAMSPLALIRGHAARAADAVALVEPDGLQLGYGQLADAVACLADELRRLGVQPRDRVAVVLPEGLDASVLLLAATSAAVAGPLNPAYSAQELDRALAELGPVLLVLGPGLSETARSVARRRGLPVAELQRDGDRFRLTPPSATLRRPPVRPDAGECLVLQTSGTTGQNKLVPLAWTTVLAGAAATSRAYQLTAADRRLNIMPLFHVQGLVGALLAALSCGSSVVCAPSPQPQDIPVWLADYRVTWFSASPALHQRILDAVPARWQPPAALRFVRSGSAALSPALRERLEAFYRVPVVESYGMTEAHQIASTPLVLGDRAMVPTGSQIGFLVDGDVVQAAGVRGEIVVRGDNVVARYLSPPQASAQAFVHGWFRTGDEGELTAAGRLTITGRIKDLIIRGGEKVAPQEVEDALLRHPAVRQAAVCAVPDPQVNEQVAAAVVLADGQTVSESALRAFARTLLAPYKIPTIIDFRTELPTASGGKVSRAALAHELGALGTPASGTGSRPPADQQTAGPRTLLEQELARLWTDAVGPAEPAIGVHDDFFALGGHSLEGVALLRTVREALGVVLHPLALFDQANTIARMAALIERQRAPAPVDTPDAQQPEPPGEPS